MFKSNVSGSVSSMALFLLIFVALITIFSTFFDADTGTLVEYDISSDEKVELPFSTNLINDSGPVYNESSGQWEESDGSASETNYVALAGGILLVIGAIALTFVTAGGAAPLIPASFAIAGGAIGGTMLVLSSSPGGRAVLHGSIVGDIMNGFNEISSAIASFVKLVFYDNALFVNIPFLRFLILIPIAFVFFYLLVTLIRGTGGG